MFWKSRKTLRLRAEKAEDERDAALINLAATTTLYLDLLKRCRESEEQHAQLRQHAAELLAEQKGIQQLHVN